MKKVLVTGAGGFIGRHTIPVLIKRGFEVHGIYMNQIPYEIDIINWHNADLLKENNTEQIIDSVQPEYLLHLAWETAHGKFWTAEINNLWVEASVKLTKQFIQNNGKRIVAAGTCAEYNFNQPNPLDENTSELNPEYLYGKCKAAFFNELKKISTENKISFAWGRIFYLYGPYENPDRLIPFVIMSLLNDKEARTTHGRQIRDYLYVEDVADAFVKILDSNINGAVNVSSGIPVELSTIINQIARKIGKEHLLKIGSLNVNPNEAVSIVGSSKKLNEELGWQPSYSLSAGLDKTIAWWREKIKIEKLQTA